MTKENTDCCGSTKDSKDRSRENINSEEQKEQEDNEEEKKDDDREVGKSRGL